MLSFPHNYDLVDVFACVLKPFVGIRRWCMWFFLKWNAFSDISGTSGGSKTCTVKWTNIQNSCLHKTVYAWQQSQPFIFKDVQKWEKPNKWLFERSAIRGAVKSPHYPTTESTKWEISQCQKLPLFYLVVLCPGYFVLYASQPHNSVHVSGLYKKASRLTLCYLNVVLPRSITTSGFFSFATVWFTRHEDCVKAWISQGVEAVQEAVWGLFVGSVRGSSLMPLSLVQGDHRGDAGTEEESLPCSRNSKKSSGSLCLVLSVWREYAYIITLWLDWQN